MILSPAGSGSSSLQLGRAVGSLFTDQIFCQATAYKATTRAAILRGLNTSLGEMTVLPPASWDPDTRLEPPKNTPSLEARLAHRSAIKERQRQHDEDDGYLEQVEEEEEEAFKLKKEVDHGSEEELQFTGRLFGGLVADVRRKLPWYRSDFTDALNIQVSQAACQGSGASLCNCRPWPPSSTSTWPPSPRPSPSEGSSATSPRVGRASWSHSWAISLPAGCSACLEVSRSLSSAAPDLSSSSRRSSSTSVKIMKSTTSP